MYSMTFAVPNPVLPPPNTPLVEELAPTDPYPTAPESPKSVTLPVLAIVIYSITLIFPPDVLPL